MKIYFLFATFLGLITTGHSVVADEAGEAGSPLIPSIGDGVGIAVATLFFFVLRKLRRYQREE